MSEEQALGFPALPIGETTYIDSLDVGTIKAGVIGSGQMKGKEIVISHEGVIRSESYSVGSLGWQINADGSAEFNDVTVRGTIEATSGELGTLNVVGTLNLVSPGIVQSSNYIAGATGWQISSSGAAEFNDVTVRGTVVATTGTLTNLTINGTLTMGFSGLIRTASSGERVEISNSALSQVRFFSSGGSQIGYIGASGSSVILIANSNSILMSAGGLMTLNATTISVSGNIQVNSAYRIQAASGSAASPGYTFVSGTSSGMYYTGSALAWSTGGVGRITVGSGFFGPVSDNVLACGSGGNRWTAVYAFNGTIQTSDARHKRDIFPMSKMEGLDAIRNLQPKNYRWEHDPARMHRGFTAQDLLGTVFQDAVWDEDGEMGVAYHEFIAPLVNAVQELAERVDELEGV